ncbi:MAG: hypothetical protein ACKD6O_08025, partial [Candidatus Bathyarchaeota archaeon]
MRVESVKKTKVFTPRYKLLALLSTLKDENNIIDKEEFIDEAEDLLREDFKDENIRMTITYYLETFKRAGIIDTSTLKNGTEIIKLNKQVIPYMLSDVISLKYVALNVIVAFASFACSIFYALITKIFEPLIVSSVFLFVSIVVMLQFQRVPIIKIIKR